MRISLPVNQFVSGCHLTKKFTELNCLLQYSAATVVYIVVSYVSVHFSVFAIIIVLEKNKEAARYF